jgi:hypothetical protein
MIEPVKSPSTRVPSQGRRAVWLVVALVSAALVFASGTQAPAAIASDAATEVPTGQAATESAASTEPEQQPPATGEPPPTEEQAPSAEESPTAGEQAPLVAAEAAPPATEQPAVESAPPTTESAPPPDEQAPPVAEPVPPATEPTPPPAEQAPPVVETTTPTPEEAPPVAETRPPTTEHVPPVDESTPPTEKKTAEQVPGGVAAGEADSEGSGQRTGGSSQASAGASGPSHNDDAAAETALGAPTASTAPDVLSEISTAQEQPSFASVSRTVSVRRADQAGCEPAVIGASIAASEVGGWLDLEAAASVSSTNFAAGDTSRTAITAGAPGASRSGGSAAENHPSAPTPGPGPGGAGGGSAAAGASGSASSASFTLVGILLQAAPRAIRRFRLAQPSWRTSFFVLIPERPD